MAAVLVMIDNYDSFTYNLVQLLRELGAEVAVFRNDAVTGAEILAMGASHLVISPGPGRPEQAGVCLQLIKQLAGQLPILGVCLGHQAIAQAFGGVVEPARRLMHGKLSPIHHLGQGLYRDLPVPFQATRYHSLLVNRDSLPDCLAVTAWTAEGEIMGLRHCRYQVEGVQFHPESIASQYGRELLGNFLNS